MTHKTVPREPSPEMLAALCSDRDLIRERAIHYWTTMYDAAPVQPTLAAPLSGLIERLRDHENEGVTGSDRFHLREEAAAAIADAYRQGMEAMREAAAKVCEEQDVRVDDCCDYSVRRCVEAILALPLEPPK